MQHHQTHPTQHPLLHLVDNRVVDEMVAHVPPPDQHVGFVEHGIAESVFGLAPIVILSLPNSDAVEKTCVWAFRTRSAENPPMQTWGTNRLRIIDTTTGDPERTTEIIIHFRRVPHSIFAGKGARTEPNKLVIGIQPQENITLSLMAKVPGLDRDGIRLRSVPLDIAMPDAFAGPTRRIG